MRSASAATAASIAALCESTALAPVSFAETIEYLGGALERVGQGVRLAEIAAPYPDAALG